MIKIQQARENIWYCESCKRYSLATKPTEFVNCSCGNKLIHIEKIILGAIHGSICDDCIELGNEVEALEKELKNLQTEHQRLKEYVAVIK